MPTPKKRPSPPTAAAARDPAEISDEADEISVGDLSHLDQAAQRGYIGERPKRD